MALNSGAEPFFASGWETGVVFFEVAQHVLFAQLPGLHARCAGALERMHDRAVRLTGAVISTAAIASEMIILLTQTGYTTSKTARRESHECFAAPARCSVRCPQRIRW